MCPKVIHLVGKDGNWPSSIPITTADLQQLYSTTDNSVRMRTTPDSDIWLIVEQV